MIIAECASRTATQAARSQFIVHRTRGLVLKPQPPDTVQPFQVIPAPGEPLLPWVAWGEQGALLWVSSRRDENTGLLARNSLIDSELRAEISEYWRLLYVAATRARDHLIFSVAANPNFRADRWNSWMPFLKNSVGFVPEALGEQPRPIGLTESNSGVDITVGFDDLPRVVVQEKQKPSEIDWSTVRYSGPSRKSLHSFPVQSIHLTSLTC